MKRAVFSCLALAAVIAIGIVVSDYARAADPAPTTREAKPAKLTLPWSLLTDLSDDQKVKITQIHRVELDAEKALKQKEREDCMAVLMPDQQKELAAAEKAKAAADRAARATQPSGD